MSSIPVNYSQSNWFVVRTLVPIDYQQIWFVVRTLVLINSKPQEMTIVLTANLIMNRHLP